jgi:hypothetical protein
MALFASDAFSPREIAERVEEAGVAKTRLPIASLIMLGMLAGAFIALGSLYYVVVASDPALGWAARRVLGGVVFSLGLLLAVVAVTFPSPDTKATTVPISIWPWIRVPATERERRGDAEVVGQIHEKVQC